MVRIYALFFSVFSYFQFTEIQTEAESRRLMAASFHSDLSRFSALDVARAKAWPKVELHLHLDGSLSPEFIAKRATIRSVLYKHQHQHTYHSHDILRGIQLPASPERLRAWLMEKKLAKYRKDDNKAEAGGNWPVFDWANQFLQTRAELTEATLDLLTRLAEDGVIYAEIRFCPDLHTLEGLTPDQAVEAVIAGFRGQSQVLGGVILVALRSKPEQHSLDTARLASKYLQRSAADRPGVVGMDVAGDEGSFPLASDTDPMAAGLREAARLGIPITVHAGEWPEKFGSLENLRWAVNNNISRRIGHAVAVRSDPALARIMRERNITVEVCLTSNIGNGYKVRDYSVHPVRLLAEAGASFSLSSDNLLLSGDSEHAAAPTAELLHLVHDVGLGWPAARRSVLSGLEAAFSPSVTQAFRDRAESMMPL